jgi:hypothetical protein
MEDYPVTLLELEKRFSNEEACRNYLFQLRWLDGFQSNGQACEGAKASTQYIGGHLS